MSGRTCSCGAYDLQGVHCPYCGRRAERVLHPEAFFRADEPVRMDTVAARDRLVARLRALDRPGAVLPTDRTAVELRYCATPPP